VGFECWYHYHEKIDGEYNKEETKILKKKVGDPFDDIPLEKLAAAIMAQLARRDIWIVNVDVFELSKKQINFKEAKGGIVIKNKKFLFDCGGDSSFVTVEDFVEGQSNQQFTVKEYQAPTQLNIQGQSLSAAKTTIHPHNQNPQQRKPVAFMVFVPEPQQLHESRRKNLRFTVNKKYAVLERRPSPTGIGEIFVIQDDTGREQAVSDAYFVPANINLIADRELGFSETQQEKDGGTLYWGNASSDPGMPDIRRR
jgi:hypothetical protein